MKKLLAILVAVVLSGCVNCHTRFPTTSSRIVQTYQSTETAFDLSLIVMFPQIMGYAHETGLIWQNIYTIPIGCVGMVDVACEAVLDTVLYPADWAISKSRKRAYDDDDDE